MMSLWYGFGAWAQDAIWLVLMLLPAALVGSVVLRGLRPWPLVRAMLWRFRGPNLLFVLLIAVAVGLGIGLLAQERGLRAGTAAAADKFDLVVAAPGSEMTMLLAAVYLQPSDVGLLSGAIYDEVAHHPNVALAAPLGFGDSYLGAPVVGTIGDFVLHLSDGNIEGRLFETSAEAVAGALAPVTIGGHFSPAHGIGDVAGDEDNAHAHEGAEYTVVGRMAPTGTPWDRALIVPIEAVWEVHGLANGHGADAGDAIGPPFDPEYFPGTPAIVVRSDALWANYALRSAFTRDAESMAFFPGAVLSQLYRVMGDVRQAMSVMALVSQVLVAASVLVGLLILIRLFRRQLALLRALGAPARFVFAVVWSYAASLLAAGACLGLVTGWLSAQLISRILSVRTDIVITAPLGWPEFHFAAGFLSVATVLSLLPGLAVRRIPIVDALRS
ncbi:FtsX-like permease family protein [Marinibacterium anthonyi]|nr:FtsX-like permease family protein [Marinibacterium anthonyi]